MVDYDLFLDKLYGGWLGKIIGVRHGANIEGWTYDKIKKTFGELNYYPFDYKNFAADDDINGPLFFQRALYDYKCNSDITPKEMGLCMLNYVPENHGFFWWGGYGISTEHTAYLNVKNGILPPASGSIGQNGKTMAEQIGGQIFSDCWGLVNPGNPYRAAEYAKKMASVTHDGEGKYGGMFIAACIAEAFVESSIESIINKALKVIPGNCEYAKCVRDVLNYYHDNPKDFRKCFEFVEKNYGYQFYKGVCHIIPNACVIIIALLYGGGDFAKTINIASMCGWDTDCNSGNAGTIIGVINGKSGIPEIWTEPINDFVCASSVIGSLNILDVPSIVAYSAYLAYKIEGEKIPDNIRDSVENSHKYKIYDFELEGSTHAFRCDSNKVKVVIKNTDDRAHSGKRSLKIALDKFKSGSEVSIYSKTYYKPEDFDDSRYDPDFSPTFYPGESFSFYISGDYSEKLSLYVRPYFKDGMSEEKYFGNEVELNGEKWINIKYDVPASKNVVVEEIGFETYIKNSENINEDTICLYIDDFKLSKGGNYSIDFSNYPMEKWNVMHSTPRAFTYFRGLWDIEDGALSGSYFGESAECYTGYYYSRDYEFSSTVVPQNEGYHGLSFRAQGAVRSYSIGLLTPNQIVLYKKIENGKFEVLKSAPFNWSIKEKYNIKVAILNNHFEIYVNDEKVMDYTDENDAYLYGCIGFCGKDGAHTHYEGFSFISRDR